MKKVNDTGVFSAQVDSTQDISAHDQCAIILRYAVGNRTKERLVRLVNVDNSSGKCLHTLQRNSLAEIGLTLEQRIGDSIDGAANMRWCSRSYSENSSLKSHPYLILCTCSKPGDQ